MELSAWKCFKGQSFKLWLQLPLRWKLLMNNLSFKVKNVASDGCLQRMAENEPIFLIA